MRLFTIALKILFLIKYIYSDGDVDDIVLLLHKVTSNLTTSETNCTDSGQCVSTQVCASCEQDRGPACDQTACIDGKCNIIQHCSQEISPTTTKDTAVSNKCLGTDASTCIFSLVCALCKDDRVPACSQAICVNDQCQIIEPCSQMSRMSTSTEMTTVAQKCETDDDCPCLDNCVKECETGSGPLCATSKCINQKCQTILPCSEISECTADNIRRCIIPMYCRQCPSGYDPPCSQATCENGQCKTISPCSIYTEPVSSPPTEFLTPTSPDPKEQCSTDGECSYVKLCMETCPDGFGPLCAYANCIDKRCVMTAPCSKVLQCTKENIANCTVPRICRLCTIGMSPPCAQAICENGQCKTVMPCSIVSNTTSTSISISTTKPPRNTCTRSSECVHPEYCHKKCPTGTGPLCASAHCVNGKCLTIRPCSQHTCTTRANCSYNKENCTRCRKGYGPACETSTCKCGFCSTVQPCSKKLQ